MHGGAWPGQWAAAPPSLLPEIGRRRHISIMASISSGVISVLIGVPENSVLGARAMAPQ